MHRRSFLHLLGLGGLAATAGWRLPLHAASGPRAAARTGRPGLDLTSVGFTRRMFATPAGEMAVFEAGAGEPLLLLHGVGAGASSYLWFRIAPALAKHYRVIAPDFVGWGDAERPDRPLLIDDYVTQIRTLGRSIGAPLRIVAQSLTCGFALRAIRGDAARDDALPVERLVLHGPSGGLDFGVDAVGAAATAQFERIALSPEREEIYASIFHQRSAVEDWYRRVGFLERDAVPTELIEAGVENARRENASYSALPFLSGELRYDIAPLLREVSVPALMLWGEGEIQIRAAVRERIEQVNPAIRSARIPNARSVFEVEQPAATVAVLLPFLRDSGK